MRGMVVAEVLIIRWSNPPQYTEFSLVKSRPISSRVSRSAANRSSTSSGSRFPPDISANCKGRPGSATWADQRSPVRVARLINNTCGSPSLAHCCSKRSSRVWAKLIWDQIWIPGDSVFIEYDVGGFIHIISATDARLRWVSGDGRLWGGRVERNLRASTSPEFGKDRLSVMDISFVISRLSLALAVGAISD
jgi:hypothetical protein